jgi:hypothetical protein
MDKVARVPNAPESGARLLLMSDTPMERVANAAEVMIAAQSADGYLGITDCQQPTPDAVKR